MVGHTFHNPGQGSDEADLPLYGGSEAAQLVGPVFGAGVGPGKSVLGHDDRFAVARGGVVEAVAQTFRCPMKEGIITLADDVERNGLRDEIVEKPLGAGPISATVNMNNNL